MRFKSAVLGLAGLALMASPGAADAPGNSTPSAAARVAHIPATIAGTLKEAKGGAVAPSSPCAETTAAVWYRLAPGASRRIVARLVAAGDLDAVIDVFAEQRSE